MVRQASNHAARSVTEPKGRPTRARNARLARRRAFGPVAQWIAVTLLLVLAFIVAFLLTRDDDAGTNGANATAAVAA